MKYLALIALVALSGCGDSDTAKFQRFARNCLMAGFAPTQCQFLYAMVASSEEAASNNLANGLVIGIAAGVSAGSSYRK